MSKPLSEMLCEFEPQLHDVLSVDGQHILTAADYNDFQRVKAVAIELAKQMEIISGKHNEFCVDDLEDAMFSADECLSRAEDILESK